MPPGEAVPGWRVVLQQQSTASHHRWVTRASGPLARDRSTAVFELAWAASRLRAARTIILRVEVLSGRRLVVQSGVRRVTVRPLVSVNAVVRHGTVELPGRVVMSTTGDPSATQTVVLAPGAHTPPVGGVLLADPSAAAPEGVLGVVTSSHRLAGGTAVLRTRPAALSEAFSAFSATLGGTLAELSSPQGTGARVADTATFTCDGHGAITHTFAVSLSDFDVSGQLEATAIAPFIELSVWAAPRVTIAVTASGSTHCESHFKPITRQLRGPLFISLQPIVTLDADGSVTMTYTWHPFFLYQFSRGQHNDHDTREFFNHGTPTLSAQVHAKAQVELAVDLSVAKRVGIGGSLGPHVDATATAHLIPPPGQACLNATAAVHYGLYVFADVFVKRWTFDLASGDFLKRTIFDGCTTPGVGREEPPKGGGEEHSGGGAGGGGEGGTTKGGSVTLSGVGETPCALRSDGNIACWGSNQFGQLGDGSSVGPETCFGNPCSRTPVAVTGITNATRISSGGAAACAVLADGTIDCWGSNLRGGLGDGTTTNSPTPVKVLTITDATAISTNGYTACALLSTGGIQCWGDNGYGQLGDGSTTNSAVPVTVKGITTAAAIFVDSNQTCALLTGGSVECWGNNEVGQLGDGTTTSSALPVTVSGVTTATTFSNGGESPCVLLIGGSIECWGAGFSGQLGDGSPPSYSATPVTVAGVTTATAISQAGEDACALLLDGSIKCWGANNHSQLGTGTAASPETCFGSPCSTIPVTVAGITTATAIDALGACARLSSGVVMCWGYNEYGQLGDGSKEDAPTPQLAEGITTAAAIGAGGAETCAVLSDGSIDCWGRNEQGELGTGSSALASPTPAKVPGFP